MIQEFVHKHYKCKILMNKNQQLTELQSFSQLGRHAHNQKLTHFKNFERIKNDINSLFTELQSDQIHIEIAEETKIRTVLRIKYFLSRQQFQKGQTQYFESPDSQEKPKKQDKRLLFFEQSSNAIQNQGQKDLKRVGSSAVIFICIIEHDLYPYSPPYLVIQQIIGLTNDLWANDFHSITDDILGNKNWFPIFTLFDVVSKIKLIVQKLKDGTLKGSYYSGKSFKREDIEKYGRSLKLHDGEFYDTKDAFIGKYVKRVIGISFKSLIIFKKDQSSRLNVCQVYSLESLDRVKIQENSERFKFVLKLKNNKEVQYKFLIKRRNISTKQQANSLMFFINWMKICLLNAEIYKFEDFDVEQDKCRQFKEKVIEQKKDANFNKNEDPNQSNASKIKMLHFKNTKRKDKINDPLVRPDSNRILQKQQNLSQILQIVDLLLASQFYKQYQHQNDRKEEFEQQIDLSDGSTIKVMIRSKQGQNYNDHNYLQSALYLQYQRLKHYEQKISRARKKLYSFFIE